MIRKWIAAGALYLACFVEGVVSIDITVDRMSDSVGLSSNCAPGAMGLCNIRSAWQLCSENVNEPCTLNLMNMYWLGPHVINPTLGHLELGTGSVITIVGNGAQIISRDDSSNRRRALSESDQSIQIISKNESFDHHIAMKDGGDKGARLLSIVYSTFPMDISRSATNSARQDYGVGCVRACPLEVLTFSSCNVHQASYQDTYFRLFDSYGIQYAENDDYCGGASEITYTVPGYYSCQDFCLHVGCYNMATCSAYVTLKHTYCPGVDNSLARFIHYVRDLNVMTMTVTKLTLNDVTFSGFGAGDGGTLYLEGEVQLSVSGCQFSSSKACRGGAIYVTQNPNYYVSIHNSAFFSSTAESGGAIYIGSNAKLSVDGTSFYSCRASKSGGAIYMGDTSGGMVVGSTFSGCTAQESGGGIYLNQGNENFYLANTVMSYCTAQGMGGGLMLNSGNNDAFVTNCEFHSCTAGTGGGGIAFNDQNSDFIVQGGLFQGCQALTNSISQGGGIFVNTYNMGGTVEHSQFFACTAGIFGGGVAVSSGNHNFKLSYAEMLDCKTSLEVYDYYGGGGVCIHHQNAIVTVEYSTFENSLGFFVGGGMLAFEDNFQLTVAHCEFTNGYSPYGGGIAIMYRNSDATVTDTTFTGCEAGSNGACLYVLEDNRNLQVTDCTFDHCHAWYLGGGVYLGTDNDGAAISGGVFRKCNARNKGGGMEIATNADVTVSGVLMEECTSMEGGGLYVDSINSNLAIFDSTFVNCNASGNGGGVYFARSNQYVSLSSVTIANCTSVAGQGGGVYIGSQNNFMNIQASTLSGCSAQLGGGLLSVSNSDLLIADSHISDCYAQTGGGIHLFADNDGVTVVRTNISRNIAGQDGGGIASETKTRNLVIADSLLHENHADRNGGGIYLHTGNAGFALLDRQCWENRVIFESDHPYENLGRWVEQTVSVPGAIGYYVFHDERTSVPPWDLFFLATYYSPMWGLDDLDFDSSVDTDWPGLGIPPKLYMTETLMLIFATSFGNSQGFSTTKADNYFGIRLTVVPIFADTIGPAILSSNTAGDSGGGLFMYSAVSYSTLVGAQFRDNTAGNGGGMFLRNAIVALVAHQVAFDRNTASTENGGGVTISSTSIGLLFKNCSFADNSAGGAGGAMAFVNNNGANGDLGDRDINELTGCTFLRNRATSHGGAIYIGTESALSISDCNIADSYSGGDGGGVMLSMSSTLTVNRSVLTNNVADVCGGALALGEDNTASISHSTILRNNATQSGGGLCSRSLSQVVLEEVSVSGCRAGNRGGGIACTGSLPPMFTRAVEFSGNTAPRGSALHLFAVSGSSALQGRAGGVDFVQNKGVVGTIYWVNGSMVSPVSLRNGSYYSDNQAEFGGELATQAVLLRVPQVIHVKKYGEFLDPVVVTLFDTYGQVSPANSPAYVQVGILGANSDQCNGRFPFLSGADVDSAGVELRDGQAILSSLEGACSPGGSVTLLFTAHLTDQPDLTTDQQTVYASAELRFRTCVAGEIILNGKCVECPYGSYSLQDNVTESTTCTECQSLGSVESCQGATIVVKESSWRRYAHSEAVLPCLDDVAGCAGGNATGDASCLIGFEGPLCSLCSEGYFLSEKTCLPCTDSDKLAPASILFIVVAAVAVVGVLAFLFYKSSRAHSGNGTGALEYMYEVASWLVDEAKEFSAQLKIMITTFQICTTIPVSMNVTFPPNFARFLDSLSFFNLNLMSAVPLSCASDQTYTFIDKLVMVTLSPIALSLLLLLMCILESAHYAVRSGGVMSQAAYDKINKVVTRYLTMFLFLTYLVLPFVSTTIFRTYICTDVDPKGEDNDSSDRFLTADMSISCTSEYYQRGVIYASIMLVVYVLGIPLLYVTLLYRSRKEILERYDAPSAPTELKDDQPAATSELDIDIDTRSEGDDEPVNQLKLRHDHAAHQALMISFLYEAYEPKYWYWEVVETTRRLVLTAVLSICGAGTSGQAILALLLALMYIKLYGHFKPYDGEDADMEAETGQFQIFLSFLGALIFQRQLLGEEWNGTVGYALIVINTSVSVLFACNVATKLHEDVQKLRKIKPSSSKKSAAPEDDIDDIELAVLDKDRVKPGYAGYAGEEDYSREMSGIVDTVLEKPGNMVGQENGHEQPLNNEDQGNVREKQGNMEGQAYVDEQPVGNEEGENACEENAALFDSVDLFKEPPAAEDEQ